MTTEAVVEVDGLRRRYGALEAVRGVSLQLRRGELFALLGTNGAGKTTTIEVLEGLQEPSAGRVRVFGLDPIRERAAVRPRTGVMLQDGGFTGALTARETLDVWRPLIAGARPTSETLELVGLTGRAEVSVENLSGGERRRLELALAVLGRPELLFLDEPTTGMDPASRRRTWVLIGELLRDGTTVLLTTHYLHEAEALADRVAIMHEGKIVVAGTPEEVVRRTPARITFRTKTSAAAVPDLPDAALNVEADRVTIESRQLQADLSRLLRWADENTIELLGLAARPASLEDVFLDVITDGDRAAATPEEAPGR